MTTMTTMTTAFPRFRVLIATVAFSAAASSLATLCAAADVNDPPTQIVKYGDLNVGSPQGATQLYGRIRQAAQNVCWSLDGRDPASHAREAACIQRAIADAVSKVNEPALFAVYNASNPVPLPAHLLSQRR